MADDSARVKLITDNLESTYQSMRRVASNLAGLLHLGRATCDEVRAYNLWALALYNEQRGMLETLRQAGQQGVPALPMNPTLFTWKNVRGEDAWKIDCSGQASSLSGAMSSAMRGPNDQTKYLSTNDLAITTSDQYVYNPERSPSFSQLYQVQQARAQQQGGLGVAPLLIIVIAGLAIAAVAAAVVAVAKYLETKEIQESNTKQVKLQADAFANYTAARLSCYADCTKGGKSAQECVSICKNLVDKPNIKTSFLSNGKWGVLQWTGFTVLAGVGVFTAVRIYQRHKSGRPVFELPDFDEGPHAA